MLRADGSDIEDLIAQFAKEFPPRDANSAAAIPAFSLALTRGTIQLEDQVAGQRWELAGVQLDADFPKTQGPRTRKIIRRGAQARPWSGRQSGDWQESPRGDWFGRNRRGLSWQPTPPSDGKPEGLGAGKVTCELKSLPVEISQGALRRFAADIRPAGALTGSLLYE